MPQSNNSRRRGFTLISLLIALGVIAITMAIGGPALWEIAWEIKLKNSAREITTAMRSARYRAINESRNFGFTVSPSRIFQGNDPNDSDATIREIPLPYGIEVRTADFDGDSFVVFNSDGSASSAGTVELKNPNEHMITVSLGPASTSRLQISKVAEVP